MARKKEENLPEKKIKKTPAQIKERDVAARKAFAISDKTPSPSVRAGGYSPRGKKIYK